MQTIWMKNEDMTIFINNKLSSYNKELFYKIKVFAKTKQFKVLCYKA